MGGQALTTDFNAVVRMEYQVLLFNRVLNIYIYIYIYIYIQSGPKKYIHSLLINIFGINLNEISISG